MEKKFTLLYNNYKIVISLKKDYKDAIKKIKETLFLQDKDFTKMNLNYIDQYGYEDTLDEQVFDFAFDSSSKLSLKPKQIYENDEEKKMDDKSSEIDLKLKSIFSNDQKEVNKKVIKTKDILFSEMYKLINEKIAENNKKYDEKLISINKKSEEKNKKLEEKIKVSNERIEKLEQINRNYCETNKDLKIEIDNLKNDINQINNTLANMKNEVKGCKDLFKKLQGLIANIPVD